MFVPVKGRPPPPGGGRRLGVLSRSSAVLSAVGGGLRLESLEERLGSVEAFSGLLRDGGLAVTSVV